MVKNTFQTGVLTLDATQGFIQCISNVFMGLVNERIEARSRGNPESAPAVIPNLFLGILSGLLRGSTVFLQLPNDFASSLLKYIRAAFQEQHAKYVFLELRGVHFTA